MRTSARAHAALRCPTCDASPSPDRDDCPGCGRNLRSATGGLDLLTDAEREEADLFASEYTSLRMREPWADEARARRAGAIAGELASMRAELGGEALIVDAGSGSSADPGVISLDLAPGAQVRGDMRRLPLRDASVDGLFFAASLHYAPADDAIREAARVLRPGGMLVAIDSPLYRGTRAVRNAVHRTAAYYESMGHPALEMHYHPIEAGALRKALVESGFEVLRLTTGSGWRRLLGGGPDSSVSARRLR